MKVWLDATSGTGLMRAGESYVPHTIYNFNQKRNVWQKIFYDIRISYIFGPQIMDVLVK